MRIHLLLAFLVPGSIALAGPDRAAAKKDAPLCEALARYIKEAPTEFKALKGAVKPNKATNFVATSVLPGAKSCTVFSRDPADADDEAFISCDMAVVGDGDLAVASFRALTAKVRACLPGSEWKIDEGKKEDGGLYWELRREDELLPFLEVDQDVDDKGSHSISVDVILPRP